MPSTPEITVFDLKGRQDSDDAPFLLDVRQPEEREIAHIEGELIPLAELPQRLDELEPHRDDEIVVYCRSGARSARAVQFLRAQGFDAVNLKGGILAWSRDIDPTMPTY